MLIHVDLLSGIGGFALAAEWAGFMTMLFVEIDKYCQKVLRKHWPDVPIVEDIRNVKAIIEEINGSTRASDEKSITLVTAGVPCQAASVAGKRKGTRDDRWLWPETFDVVRAIRPKWCLFENVAGILTLEHELVFNNLLSELEGIGYEIETYTIPACAVNAPHRRDRVWIVAHHSNDGLSRSRLSISKWRQKQKNLDTSRKSKAMAHDSSLRSNRMPSQSQCKTPLQPQIGANGQNASVAECQRQADNQRGQTYEVLEGQTLPDRDSREIRTNEYWRIEPELGRVAHGIPDRVDRLKCLGNAIVPQVAYQILKVIAEIESCYS